MGLIGAGIGGLAGGGIGETVGKHYFGDAGASIGKQLGTAGGEFLGAMLPFKKGGRVKKTGPALVHKGEFILPKSVKPTKAQLAKVAKLHMK